MATTTTVVPGQPEGLTSMPITMTTGNATEPLSATTPFLMPSAAKPYNQSQVVG